MHGICEWSFCVRENAPINMFASVLCLCDVICGRMPLINHVCSEYRVQDPQALIRHFQKYKCEINLYMKGQQLDKFLLNQLKCNSFSLITCVYRNNLKCSLRYINCAISILVEEPTWSWSMITYIMLMVLLIHLDLRYNLILESPSINVSQIQWLVVLKSHPLQIEPH